MTIAACYLSPEGVVFGADSTTTFTADQRPSRHYDYAQKIFEVGASDSTLGIATWGMASLPGTSYRTLIAQFAERNLTQQTSSVSEAAQSFGQFFWSEYNTREATRIFQARQWAAQLNLSPDQQRERDNFIQNLYAGFCLGGNLLHERAPQAFAIHFNALANGPNIEVVPLNGMRFWGVGNLINRLFLGIDPDLATEILQSGKWTGTPAEFSSLVERRMLAPAGSLPLREAIDLIHASVYCTIKAMKFSQLSPICGGPVELAVITTDRPFRWVCHKTLDAAIPLAEYSYG